VGLAEEVVRLAEGGAAQFKPLYPADMPLVHKIETIAREIYGAKDIAIAPAAAKKLAALEADGFGYLPVCMAKTQYSFSTDPDLRGAPEGHTVPVRDIRLSAGAGFVVVLCGDIMTMPGLPRRPAAELIGVDAAGEITGLS
jgi:formate--tetrahydrofolate ligase